ncbi:acyl-CoA carboxylase epsilon subunit [Actinomadura sp. WMMA1423]|uniref:acyl-CoA carboxylase epsilon subunit n=1 Tax=Actinomadura sp. WMMA1423 TaxID=2591108 RepID=UPI00114752EB|nr:acyl-CoA carboxylase epsilon subunit [Actinomadura sp. WMMA1423]
MTAQEGGPWFTVVRGALDDDGIAALAAVLRARAQAAGRAAPAGDARDARRLGVRRHRPAGAWTSRPRWPEG